MSNSPEKPEHPSADNRSTIQWMTLIRVFSTFLRLGLTSFGGPVAHLGYFHDTFVRRKQWLKEEEFADTVSLCQLLPGATSSQIGMAIGLKRAGRWGALAAWLGFTIPSAIIMTSVGFAFNNFSALVGSGAIRGLKLAALAVVSHACFTMFKNLCPDTPRRLIALTTAAVLMLKLTLFSHITLLVISGVLGIVLFTHSSSAEQQLQKLNLTLRPFIFHLSIFSLLLVFLPIFAETYPQSALELFDRFYRSGALVFGGGHVVLPLLSKEFVDTQLVGREIFLAGYGIAQAIPGPLFSFAAFLAVSIEGQQGPLSVANLALCAIFLPSFLLVLGLFPIWTQIRDLTLVKSAITGMNAAVVGFLLATLGSAFLSEAKFQWFDLICFGLCFVCLKFLKTPSWVVVIIAGFAAILFN